MSSLAAFAGRVLYVYKLGYPRRDDPVKYKAVMKVRTEEFWILGGLEDQWIVEDWMVGGWVNGRFCCDKLTISFRYGYRSFSVIWGSIKGKETQQTIATRQGRRFTHHGSCFKSHACQRPSRCIAMWWLFIYSIFICIERSIFSNRFVHLQYIVRSLWSFQILPKA